MDAIIEAIRNGMLAAFKHEEIVTLLISVIPIVEVRGAIPLAIGYGMNPLKAGLLAFLGASAIVPLLLLALIPFINWLSRTKVFKKIGTVLYERIEKKSHSIKDGPASVSDGVKEAQPSEKSAEIKKLERKKLIGILLFVAVPLPLTGVWTGSAIAAIIKLDFKKSLIAVIGGNFIASSIMTLLCALFKKYVNLITLIIGIIAIAVAAALILKIIFSKPKTNNTINPGNGEN